MRTNGDTVERLEALALNLVGGRKPDDTWTSARAVLDTIFQKHRPNVAACGGAEIAGALAALDGRFLAPGPSGAPTRGRPEVLPTGRNFYSVDTRTVPTPTAWTLGWKSATLVIQRHAQEHGDWPRQMALSAWGTSNMRTGGDDIAQGLALMGVQPTWDRGSGRVTGFEIMPLDVLDRPRVDVTLRLSGFSEMLFRSRSTCSTALPARSPSWMNRRTKIRLPPASRKMPQRSSPMASIQTPPTDAPVTGVRVQARRLRGGAAGADRRTRLGYRC